MDSEFLDHEIRMAAFEHLRDLVRLHERLNWQVIEKGFWFNGEKVHFATRPKGIFKPRQMTHLLSIRTVVPRPGRGIWYHDQERVHGQIFDAQDVVDYAFSGTNPLDSDNQLLLNAYKNDIAIIYFIGVAPGVYEACFPSFISGWDANESCAYVGFGQLDRDRPVKPENAVDRRYSMGKVKRRLHQSRFREMVMTAYGCRCALSGLPETGLLDAAHIVPDVDERLGQPLVRNGILLSKLHHAAFDKHLIGIDPMFRVHVSEQLFDQSDGPMLGALKSLRDKEILLPDNHADWPDRERLAQRFETFREAA